MLVPALGMWLRPLNDREVEEAEGAEECLLAKKSSSERKCSAVEAEARAAGVCEEEDLFFSRMTASIQAALVEWSERLSSGRGAADEAAEAELEVESWQFDDAASIVSTFCCTYPATRAVPTLEELDTLWLRCTSLHPAAVSNAFCEQLIGDTSEFEWQPKLRILHILELFAARGGSGREAAATAVTDARELLEYLSTEVPQCREKARQVLELKSVAGEEHQWVTRERHVPQGSEQHTESETTEGQHSSSTFTASSSEEEVDKPGERVVVESAQPRATARSAVPLLVKPPAPRVGTSLQVWRAQAPREWEATRQSEVRSPTAASMQDPRAWAESEKNEGNAEKDTVSEEDSISTEIVVLNVGQHVLQQSSAEVGVHDVGYHWLEKSAVEAASFDGLKDPFLCLGMHVAKLRDEGI